MCTVRFKDSLRIIYSQSHLFNKAYILSLQLSSLFQQGRIIRQNNCNNFTGTSVRFDLSGMCGKRHSMWAPLYIVYLFIIRGALCRITKLQMKGE